MPTRIRVFTQLYVVVTMVYDAIVSLILLELVDLKVALGIDGECLDSATHGEAVQRTASLRRPTRCSTGW